MEPQERLKEMVFRQLFVKRKFFNVKLITRSCVKGFKLWILQEFKNGFANQHRLQWMEPQERLKEMVFRQLFVKRKFSTLSKLPDLFLTLFV